MRKQYHFWPNERGGHDAWDVDGPIELSSGLPVVEIEVATIGGTASRDHYGWAG